jgi:hypothetical protein
MKMNRRTFQSTLLLAVGAGICSVAPTAFAATSPVYRHRIRFRREGGIYSFWMRVAQPSNMSSDVPFTLQFSTDAAGQKVIYSAAHVARVASSHLVRGRIDMAAAGWTRGSPLYAKFLLGAQQTPAAVKRLIPLPKD